MGRKDKIMNKDIENAVLAMLALSEQQQTVAEKVAKTCRMIEDKVFLADGKIKWSDARAGTPKATHGIKWTTENDIRVILKKRGINSCTDGRVVFLEKGESE
jgi:hypothetical protein